MSSLFSPFRSLTRVHGTSSAARPSANAWRAGLLSGALLCTSAWSQPGAAPAKDVPVQARPIFVLNSQDASVSVIDPVTHTELKRIAVGKEPHHLYLTPDRKSLLVANALSNTLTFIDPATAQVQRTLAGIADPYQLRFSPDMKWFVTLANRLNHIDLYR